jgi:hypothetical protein
MLNIYISYQQIIGTNLIHLLVKQCRDIVNLTGLLRGTGRSLNIKRFERIKNI